MRFTNSIPLFHFNLLLILVVFAQSCSRPNASAFCDAENKSGNYFVAELKGNGFVDSLFQNSANQVMGIAHSGKHSIVIAKNCPYGFTYKFVPLIQAQRIHIRVWRHQKFNGGCLAIAAENLTDLFLTQHK